MWLHSDPLLVQRILLNLVGNAMRYTRRGGVLVDSAQARRRARIAVWDTGPGIPDERRDDVFREFVQLDPQRFADAPANARRVVSGSGWRSSRGWPICSARASSCARASAAGRCSRSSCRSAARVHRGCQSAALPAAGDLRGTFALVIDDDEAARAGMCGLLASWGCLTLAAADGADAVAQLAAHDRPPELIVCDYRLGDATTGLDAIARMRGCARAVPAILVTADTSSAVASAARALSVPLLHKPVSPVKLRALLAQVLSHAQAGERALT